jgi:aarF domain-containing kinase
MALTDCCMSGCVHCVYDIHFDALLDYQEDLTESRNKLLSLQPPTSDADWDVSLLGERPDGDTKLEGSAAVREAQSEVDAAIEKLDPSMKAFLQLERSIKKNNNSSKQV